MEFINLWFRWFAFLIIYTFWSFILLIWFVYYYNHHICNIIIIWSLIFRKIFSFFSQENILNMGKCFFATAFSKKMYAVFIIENLFKCQCDNDIKYILDVIEQSITFLFFSWPLTAAISSERHREFVFPPDLAFREVFEVSEIFQPDYSSPADYSIPWRINEISEEPSRWDFPYREAVRRPLPYYYPDEDRHSHRTHEEPPVPRKRQGIVSETA